MPREGKPTMAERAVLRWADVPEAERSAHMAELARRRWAVRDA